MINENEVKSKLALALDVDDLVVATRMARSLQPFFSTIKVGLELFAATGPESVGVFLNLGYSVFLDLKFHDIPTTVKKASKVIGGLGASYLTIHASGGVEMLRAGVEGLAEGALEAGAKVPMALAVTILTSDDQASEHVLADRLSVATQASCGGYVCGSRDLRSAKSLAPGLIAVVPGTRPEGSEAHEQRRSTTPNQAITDGADLLVIGRAVTLADDPVAAAEAIFQAILAQNR